MRIYINMNYYICCASWWECKWEGKTRHSNVAITVNNRNFLCFLNSKAILLNFGLHPRVILRKWFEMLKCTHKDKKKTVTLCKVSIKSLFFSFLCGPECFRSDWLNYLQILSVIIYCVYVLKSVFTCLYECVSNRMRSHECLQIWHSLILSDEGLVTLTLNHTSTHIHVIYRNLV